ncbi:unnamed protein product [Paramecium sonneborni]|uniref:Uncharacterized protein n=1 Tax=Paramecium sonneborni TaxID=65129 RepID=A0A8S1RPM1_9CILI|nr:unnamed protein product [Paramecium sonneborni]
MVHTWDQELEICQCQLLSPNLYQFIVVLKKQVVQDVLKVKVCKVVNESEQQFSQADRLPLRMQQKLFQCSL